MLTDLDGDGHLDIVAEGTAVTNSQVSAQIVFLHGNADGTFAAAAPIVSPLQTTTGMLVDVADYNGDGILDLVVTNQVGIGILLGKGNLTYSPVMSYLSGPATFGAGMAFGTFTGSGHRDIAMGVEGGIVELLNNGDGTFASAPFYDLGAAVGAAAVADFNGDGNADIAVAVPSEFPRVLLGKGDGTFQLETDQNTSYGTARPASAMTAADFAGSHVVDIVAPSSGGQVTAGTPEVLFGKGDGTFSVPLEEDSGSTAVADFNGDARADMVSAVGSDITVLLGQAGGTFTPATTQLRTPTYTNSVSAIGDLNGDGKPDLLIGTQVWLGNGNGTFTYKETLDLSAVLLSSVGPAVIADLDGDGKADLVLLGESGLQELVILYGNGDGTFQSPVLYPISHNYSALTVADVNADGRPDLILNDNAGIAVIRNLGTKHFATEEHYVAGGASVSGGGIGTVSLADLNHDGYPDIVATNALGTAVAVLLNQPSVPYSGGPAPVGTLVFAPEPSVDLQPFQGILTLLSPTIGGAAPTGSVTFSVDGGFVANVALNAGLASFTDSSSLRPGVHTVTAAFNGDKNYRSASFIALHIVNPPVYSTGTALTVTPTSLLTSQTVHMQATVTATGQTPVGFVTFLNDGQTLAAAQLNSSGIAYFDTALLSAGSHSIIAEYDGYASQNNFNPEVFSSSASAPATVTVSDVPTVTTLSVSSNTPTSGTVLTITATVSSAKGTPFGGVTFFDGTTELGTIPLSGGQAVFSTASLSTGQHAFTARYNANASWGSSASQQQPVTIQAASARLIPTFTSVSAVPNSTGKGIQLASLVSSSAATPSGTITFLMDGTVLGTAPVDETGAATLVSSAAPANGQHEFSASFSGSTVFAPSVSPALDQAGQRAGSGFSLSLDASAVSVSPFSPATIHILISAPAGFSQMVGLSCAYGLPKGYSCDFAPSTLSGSGTAILTISANRSSQGSSGTSWRRKGELGISLSLLLLLPVLKRRGGRWLILMFALGSLIVMPSACSVAVRDARATEVSIIVLRASAGTGSITVVNSAQFTLRIKP